MLTSAALAIPFTTPAHDLSDAAADAFANEKEAGLGGWFDMGEGCDPKSVAWFQLRVTPSLFPKEWQLRDVPQRDISFYELIAQVCLFFARSTYQSVAKVVVNLRQDSDNLTSVCVGNKLFSTATPMRYAAQLLAAHALRNRCYVDLQHIPGASNDLADRLSRQHDPQSIGLSLQKQVWVSIPQLLESYYMWSSS